MRKTVVALGVVLSAVAFASVTPVFAADEAPKHQQPAGEFTFVRGAIDKIDGKTLTVKSKDGDKTVTYDDKTEIVKNKAAYTEALKVGDFITAKINKSGVAVRIELRTPGAHKGGEGTRRSEAK